MKISRLQNIVIFFLVALTFLQTGELWFGGTPNRNFFYSFFSAGTDASATENLPDLTKPYRIAASVAQDHYVMKYSGIAGSEQKKILDNAMADLFADGEFIGVAAMDWSVLNQSLLFEYRCAIPADAFTAAYKQKANLISSRLSEFDRILLVPGETADQPVGILFHETLTDQCYTFSVAASDLYLGIQAARANLTVANEQLYYIASSSLPIDLFSEHVFIPVWDGEALSYTDIEKVNPYAEDGVILSYTVEDNINMFFNNPGQKHYALINDVYTFSDETTVVKYHKSNVLECSNYETADDDRTTTFSSAFNQAIGFIKRDTTIGAADDYYLSGYQENPDGSWQFYFDFTINDLPVFLSNRVGSEPQLDHAIEVTVAHDLVTKYMRSAYLYQTREDTSAATENGFDALDSAVNNFAVSDEAGGEEIYPAESIRSVDIGYNIDNSETVGLYWYVGYTEIASKYAFSAN